jgi:hypothetical protein
LSAHENSPSAFFCGIAAAMILQPTVGSSDWETVIFTAAEGFHEYLPASQMRSKRRRFPGFESAIIRRHEQDNRIKFNSTISLKHARISLHWRPKDNRLLANNKPPSLQILMSYL